MPEINDILPKLKGLKKVGDGYLAFCPSHDDVNNRSLSITEKDGKLLMHCFCGCTYGEILNAINIPPEAQKPEIEAIYDYTDENRKILYQVVRYFPKAFKHRHLENGEYVWNLKGVRRVLFHLPELIKTISNGEIIYIVEGERDCINLADKGIAATTLSGGANSKWEARYTELFLGALVGIIPDDDKPGLEYAHRIASCLYGWAASLRIIKLGSKDATEWLKTHNAEELRGLWDSTPEYVPAGAVTRDEFNDLKGHVHYLHTLFEEIKSKDDRRRESESEFNTLGEGGGVNGVGGGEGGGV